MLCVAWSPDGRLIAAGAEDDLIHVYSTEESKVVLRCQGHKWVQVQFRKLCLEQSFQSRVFLLFKKHQIIKVWQWMWRPKTVHFGFCSQFLAVNFASNIVAGVLSNFVMSNVIYWGIRVKKWLDYEWFDVCAKLFDFVRSWVSSLAFDCHFAPPHTVRDTVKTYSQRSGKWSHYRLGSVSHDTYFCLWEISDEILSSSFLRQLSGARTRSRNSSGGICFIWSICHDRSW